MQLRKSLDPKADPMLAPRLQEMLARGEAYRAECKRRGLRFLPKQVMRPILTESGLGVGPMLAARSSDHLVM